MSTKSLNIKNPEVHALATELAQLRSVSVTQAVLEAVRNQLKQERERNAEAALEEDLFAIAKRCAAHMKGPVSSADHATMLCDDKGLPR